MAKADGAAVAEQLRKLVSDTRTDTYDTLAAHVDPEHLGLLYADLLGRLTGALSMLATELEAHHG